MAILSIVFIPAVLLPLAFDLPRGVENSLDVASWVIWAAFATEYLVLLYLAPSRRTMVRSHLFDLFVLLLPMFRPLRAARGLRALRSASTLRRNVDGLRRVAVRHGFYGFAGVSLIIVAGGGFVVYAIEHDRAGANIGTIGDALWWAISTATTIGYGDYTPVTIEGRMVAIVLMLVGIGMLSVITANIAAYFVQTEEGPALQVIKEQLTEVRAALERLESERDTRPRDVVTNAGQLPAPHTATHSDADSCS